VLHAGKSFIAATAVLLSVAQAAAEPALAQKKLTLRSGPGPAFTTLAIVPSGTKLDAQKCADEWCRVKLGHLVGYVGRAFLKTGADSYASATPHPAPAPVEPKPTATGPHVWQWRDSDWRNEHWRQIEWQNRLNR
jgi:uncharacterized protein YraI